MGRLITGLDIGTQSIKCIVAEEKKNGSLSVLSIVKEPSGGFQGGVLVDLEESAQVLRELVLDLQKVSKSAVHNVFVNANSAHIRTRISRGLTAVSRADREIQQDDIEKAIQLAHAVKQQPNYMMLHNIVREYFVDDVGNMHDPLGMTGNRLEASTLIIEAFTPQISILGKTLERVGMKVNGCIFNPIAASRAVLTQPQRNLGVLLIDFGFHTTSFVVYEEGKLSYAKSVPVGAQHITNDLAIGLQISVEAAEKLKISVGDAMAENVPRKEVIDLSEFEPKNHTQVPRRFIAEIIEARLSEIMDLVATELKVLGKNPRFPSGIVVTGGGSKLHGLSDFVQKSMKSYVQLGFSQASEFDIVNPTHREHLEDSQFSVALGLVLWGRTEDATPRSLGESFRNFLKNLIP
jgi:cell division protein FtsA